MDTIFKNALFIYKLHQVTYVMQVFSYNSTIYSLFPGVIIGMIFLYALYKVISLYKCKDFESMNFLENFGR